MTKTVLYISEEMMVLSIIGVGASGYPLGVRVGNTIQQTHKKVPSGLLI